MPGQLSFDKIPDGAYEWAMKKDTGTSSETIWWVLSGLKAIPGCRYLGNPPLDSEDFGRCHTLLKMAPEWRPRLGEVAKRFKAWEPVVEAWDRLESLYDGRKYNEVTRILWPN